MDLTTYLLAKNYVDSRLAAIGGSSSGGTTVSDIEKITGKVPSGAANLVDYINQQTSIKIKVNDSILNPVNGIVEIPLATQERYGLVKGSDEIVIGDDGALSVSSVNVNKLIQNEGDELILEC